MKTSELTGAALDWAVAQAAGYTINSLDLLYDIKSYDKFRPSTDWAHGGPFIERERITISPYSDDDPPMGVDAEDYVEWLAIRTDPEGLCGTDVYDSSFEIRGDFTSRGTTPLIASMRCYVALMLGDEVEIPPELQSSA